ncbi:MAG: hypothetical protein J6N78_01495 [Clostridia bacterium]|nr:hypothetical protein [Clostridia bacterium]
MKRYKRFIYLFLILLFMFSFTFISNATEIENANYEDMQKSENKNEQEKIGVTYKTHVQDVGWQSWKKDGETAGTSGRSLRLEGIYIKLNGTEDINVKYQTHIQDVGWQDWKKSGEFSGTEGRSLRLEGIRIELENTEKYSIAYRVHVQDIGWQDWKYDGEMAGTQGRSLRLEAIEIKIVDKIQKAKLCIDTKIKDVYYKNEIIEVAGWKMGTKKDMQLKVLIDDKKNVITEKDISYRERPDVIKAVEGYGTKIENPTPGFNFQLKSNDLEEGNHTIKVIVVAANGETKTSYSKKISIDKQMHIYYQTHVQNIGWQNYKLDGDTAGTSGQSLRLEALKIKGVNLPEGVEVKYKTHIQNIGWQDWKTNDELSGTSGQSLRLEALKIKLKGTDEYSIMYRTHVENIGWQDWCYDGESAGTFGRSLRLEAIEIKIVPRINKTKMKIEIDTPRDQIENTTQNIQGWAMTSIQGVNLKILIDNKEIDITKLNRTTRDDVLNEIKGYGDETIYNKKPGFCLGVDFSKFNIGYHTLKIQGSINGKIIAESEVRFRIRKKIEYSSGTYGVTGLKYKGDPRGSNLIYYKYGSGPNVLFATYAIHGFEDKWGMDGWELATIASKFFDTLVDIKDYDINEKWTIYIFPGVNMDGLNYGNTNNGPGRTTLTSADGHGVDLNRCWSENFQANYSDRNYTGSEPFLAYEARYLRDFMLNHRTESGQNVLVDLHGWTQQLIGNREICNFYGKQFPENNRDSIERYGTGYLIGWARKNLGNKNKTAKTALIELPYDGVNSHQDVINKRFYERYIQATLDMLRNMQC